MNLAGVGPPRTRAGLAISRDELSEEQPDQREAADPDRVAELSGPIE